MDLKILDGPLRPLDWAFAAIAAALLFWGVEAYADEGPADPQCIPGHPLYIEPFDPATGPYLRPNRNVSFCTSALPNSISEIQMVCKVSVDGVPYAQATRYQRQVITLTNLAIEAGPMETRCSFMGIDAEGQPVEIFSLVSHVFYEPVPIPEAPVPLDYTPPSL